MLGEFIKIIIVAIAVIILSIILSAYVWYFVGMTVYVTAGKLFGIAGSEFTALFAWIGVGVVVVFLIVLVAKLVPGIAAIYRFDISKDDNERE